MNKVTIKKVPFKLNGDIIGKGEVLDFKALDRNNKEVSFSDIKGKVIMSTFPDINTRVCDAQTQWIARQAFQNKGVRFLSITTDPVEVVNEWCAANDLDNVDIWSDINLEFANQTNTLITRVKKLARGFILVEDGEIKDIVFKKEISDDPDYDKVMEWIK